MCFIFFNDTATTEIYTLSLHDALPICMSVVDRNILRLAPYEMIYVEDVPPEVAIGEAMELAKGFSGDERSEEHTSELQSRQYPVCRLLLEKSIESSSCTSLSLTSSLQS